MRATAKKGIWVEELVRGYSLKINTRTNKIKIFRRGDHIITVDIEHDIYPEDVANVREKVFAQFINQTEEL